MPVYLTRDADKDAIWEENQRLRRELEKARRELEEYKKRHPETVGVKHGKAYEIKLPPPEPEADSPGGKQPGGQPGHPGHHRPPPARIDHRVRVPTPQCPDCGGHRLSRIQETRRRTVEDIPITQPVNTEFFIDRRYCRDCKRLVEAPTPGVLPNARIGLRTMLWIAWVRLALRVPEDVVPDLLLKTYGLRISTGEVQNVLDQLATAYGPFYETLVADLRRRSAKHADESTWRTNGDNEYVWTFVTKWEAVFVIRQSRAHDVPLEILGDKASGTITTDGHSAYHTLVDKTRLVRQRCWAHVLGDAKELAQFYGREGELILQGLKAVYAHAATYHGQGTPDDVALLTMALQAILDHPYRSHHCATFARNHLAKSDELFRFVTDPAVEGTNNRAERAIRPFVIARKISGGSRSPKSAQVRALLTSVLQTLALRGEDFLRGPGLQPRPASDD